MTAAPTEHHLARSRTGALVLILLLGGGLPAAARDYAPETAVERIPLKGPLASADAEVSGLAWYRDHLILLPQSEPPEGEEIRPSLYALSKDDILARLFGPRRTALDPEPIDVDLGDLQEKLSAFEGFQQFDGFEAIAFQGDRAFLTIEARTSEEKMRGFLVTGILARDLSVLRLETDSIRAIDPQTSLDNYSEESVFVAHGSVLTLYEVNGSAVDGKRPDGASPRAHVFGTDLGPRGTIPFPDDVEYRITDVTDLDATGRFWAINYFFPGDEELTPRSDPLAEEYGQGETHLHSRVVERLVELEYRPAGITRVDRPPIQLELHPEGPRNWEGLARLDDRGFLLVTDKHPETLLAFVPADAPGVDERLLQCPASGPSPSLVTLRGANFGAQQGTGTLQLARARAPAPEDAVVTLWTNDRVVLQIPANLDTGEAVQILMRPEGSTTPLTTTFTVS